MLLLFAARGRDASGLDDGVGCSSSNGPQRRRQQVDPDVLVLPRRQRRPDRPRRVHRRPRRRPAQHAHSLSVSYSLIINCSDDRSTSSSDQSTSSWASICSSSTHSPSDESVHHYRRRDRDGHQLFALHKIIIVNKHSSNLHFQFHG